MDKGRILLSAGGLVLVLAVFAAFQTARLWSQEELREVEQEAAAMRGQRDSLLAVAAMRDSARAQIERVVATIGGETESLRLQVDLMERERAAAQLDVWLLRTSDDTERQFRESFPEFANAMRVTEMRPEPEAPSLRYLMVPLNSARSFIVYRQNSASFEEQRDALQALDSLNLEIIALQDSIVTLTRLNEQAYRFGYDSAYARYEDRTQDYIDLLGQPRFKLDLPSVSTLVGAAAVGIVLGTQIN